MVQSCLFGVHVGNFLTEPVICPCFEGSPLLLEKPFVPGWAKGFDTECSFVSETSETGAEQPARAPQTLPLSGGR